MLAKHLEHRLNCATRGCEAFALDDSNYCANHQPQLSIEQSVLPPLRTQIAIAVVCTAIAVWFLPWITSAIKAASGPRQIVQTFVLHTSCPRRPAPDEQLVVLAGSDGSPHECVYVQSRGAYGVTK